MKIKLYHIAILSFLLLYSCKNGAASSQNKVEIAQDTIKPIVLPILPEMMTDPDQRAVYLTQHYWDNVNFADSNYIHHPDVTEQGFVDFVDLLSHVPMDVAQKAMRTMIDQTNANKKVFDYMTNLADQYLYDPNSPMRNEEYYIPVLEAMVASPSLDKTNKIRPTTRLELAKKNRVNTKALNFSYTLANGSQGSLYQLNADYILLFFSNPGCPACSETIKELKEAPVINKLLDEKKLIVLSVYPDEDLEEWHKHQSEFSKKWINAYDKKLMIRDQQVYDLRAIPNLYLLNKDKQVLLKDAPAQVIEQYLAAHQ